jgi:hypothetical protein
VRRDSSHVRCRSELSKKNSCEKFSLQDNSTNLHLYAVTPRTPLYARARRAAGKRRTPGTYADEASEPSVVLPPRSSAPPPPALADAAFHGISGLLVRALAHILRPIPPRSSSSSWRPWQPRRPRPALPRRHHPSRPQSLRHSCRRIEQGRQRDQLARDPRPLRRSRPALVFALRDHRRPRTVRKSLDQSTKAGNRHPRNRPLWRIRRLRRTLPPIRRIRRPIMDIALATPVCHNRWPRLLTRVFVAVIERTYPEGWHA